MQQCVFYISDYGRQCDTDIIYGSISDLVFNVPDVFADTATAEFHSCVWHAHTNDSGKLFQRATKLNK